MTAALENYYRMVERVDELCGSILALLGDAITCSKGCSGCCTAITLFPVEAAALSEAIGLLPAEDQESIRRHAAAGEREGRCPLLKEGACLLYSSRPVICRTHGLPILYADGEGQRVDCCPLNAVGNDLPGQAVIDIDRLNTLLVAVNANYLAAAGSSGPAERVTLAAALKVIP